ncbi:G-protein coupled receptors family 1 profile domain-containing protein [Caenorhabditis elegans]|uniref:G-protein coupled receptors family 1 profile domain-containing protein n=1 Tax=Caenorhabditis elegans TaxID=6239 RepID=Q7Z2B2_CAEEL|nr:G-protein coupled receptors family 1 profile domain-containing protein [Caenorhabditis elegans]CCD74376.1 G-protein coupled receptors family 1 profile domain-containing protein [Caenorhabditis elegans]|eukprot:NP_001024316.1 Serpentine Receptor, class W [Caenorhabditis elegans]
MSLVSDAENLQNVENVVNNIGLYFQRANLFLSLMSIILNVFHILVLSNKSMRTSSTNVILIGLSISDLGIAMSTMYKQMFMVDPQNSECITATSLSKVYMDITAWSVLIYFRRCSSFLGVLMASVRYVIMKKPTVSRYSNWSKPSVGWTLTGSVFCISGLLTIFYQARWIVVANQTAPLPITCAQFQNLNSKPPYSVILAHIFSANDAIIHRSYMIMDVLISRFIPCVAFIILTIALLRILQSIKITNLTRRKSSVHHDEKRDLSTKLIVVMTFTFVLIETPLGMIYMGRVIFDKNLMITLLSTDLAVYFLMLVTINSILHPTFCILMSSQYRNTIRLMLGLTRSAKLSSARNKTSVASAPKFQIT